MTEIERRGSTAIVYHAPGFGCCWPPRPWGVRLPSGLVHPFESEQDARDSQYWPFKTYGPKELET